MSGVMLSSAIAVIAAAVYFRLASGAHYARRAMWLCFGWAIVVSLWVFERAFSNAGRIGSPRGLATLVAGVGILVMVVAAGAFVGLIVVFATMTTRLVRERRRPLAPSEPKLTWADVFNSPVLAKDLPRSDEDKPPTLPNYPG